MTNMTICDYHMTMNVGIAELKAKLSHHLRAVRHGHPVTVMDRNQPIATIVPHNRETTLQVRKPRPGAPPLQEVRLPPPLDLDLDIVELLLVDRQIER